jgi:transposase
MLAEEVDYVVGVDTHRDQHVLAIVVAPTGGVVGQRSVRANARGYAEAVRFANACAVGARVWAIEGAGHYGAGLSAPIGGCAASRPSIRATLWRNQHRTPSEDESPP